MKYEEAMADLEGLIRLTKDDKSGRHTAMKALMYLSGFIIELGKMTDTTVLTKSHAAVKHMDTLYTLKELIAALLKTPVEALYDRTRFNIVPEIFNAEETKSITVEGIGRCVVQDDINVTVPEELKEPLYKWLTEKEHEDMIKETVNAQTLTAFVRQCIKNDAKKAAEMQKRGEDPSKIEPSYPTHLMNVKPVSRAVITRSY